MFFPPQKVMLEFQEAALSGAAAIASGQVPPINPTEPARQHVFVFNGTFFSFGVDSKDAYKVFNFFFFFKYPPPPRWLGVNIFLFLTLNPPCPPILTFCMCQR